MRAAGAAVRSSCFLALPRAIVSFVLILISLPVWFWFSWAGLGWVEVLLNMASFTANIHLKISRVCVVLMAPILECDDVIFLRLV